MRATPTNILAILERLDWTGHVEVGFGDMQWIASAIAAELSPDDGEMCDNCETPKPFVVETSLGAICEDCLKEINATANEVRDTMEEE